MYASDFLVDTNDWTVDEVGIYLRLLLSEWVNGELPNDERRLARIAGCSYQKFKKKWSKVECKFEIKNSVFLINKRLEREREKQDNYRKLQAEKGKLGGRPQKSRSFPGALTEQKPNKSSSSSSSSSIKIKDIYSRVIEYLNLQTGKNFRVSNKKTQALIKARLNEEFTEQDFINVIDNKMNWLSDPKMVEFLRPETLFGTKFESYLQDNKKEDLMDKWVRDKEKEEGDG